MIDLLARLLEGCRDSVDVKALLHASHDFKSVLLVWWYHLVSGEFRKSKDPKTVHGGSEDEEFLKRIEKEEGGEKPWVTGRAFTYGDKVYLLVYWPALKGLSASTLIDLLHKVSNSLDVTVDCVIDDGGNDLSRMLESCSKVC